MTKIGYARVSTRDQDPQLQLDALEAAGCDRVFVDHASGTKADRPELAAALAYLRKGDQLVVWKLDRLGRSVQHLVNLVDELGQQGVDFTSLTDGLDTTTPAGKLLFHVVAAVAQFERDLVVERTTAGLDAAKAKGKRSGGRPSAMTAAKVTAAKAMLASGNHTMDEIAAAVGVSRATLYRHLQPDA